jgi:serine/threonine-protein kinase RsbW
MSETGRFTLVVAADPDSLDTVHEALEELWATQPSVSDLDRTRFETGLIEILANIVEHSFDGAAPVGDGDGGDDARNARRLKVVVKVDDENLLAVLSDNGLPVFIDLSTVTMPDEDAESGRGLALALAALDELSYARVDGCNSWTLSCRRGKG